MENIKSVTRHDGLARSRDSSLHQRNVFLLRVTQCLLSVSPMSESVKR
jgi:hypothetical protein